MSKFDKIVLVILMFVIGGIFFFNANIFDTIIGYLEIKIRYLTSQCEYHADPYICDRLIRLYQYQLDVVENLYIAFTTIGWTLIILGIIYIIATIEKRE